MTAYSSLLLGDLPDLHLRIIPHPGATLLSLTGDLFGNRRHAVPRPARNAVRRHAPSHTEETLRPLFAPEHAAIPDCLTPTASMSHEGAEHHLEQLLSTSPDTLLTSVAEEFGGTVPAQWRPVVDRPRTWLTRYGDVLRGLWQATEPVWRAAGRALSHEAERAGSAVVHGRPEAILSGLSPRYRYTDAALHLPDTHPELFDLRGRRLVLVPVVSGSTASLFACDHPDFVWIGYPLPEVPALWSGNLPSPPRTRDTARLVLGDARAAILRAVNRPLPMGDLAASLHYAPATLSHHCARLEEAGLIERRRQGQRVVVESSPRGAELLDLLSR
jgi:DNA-binding transcriptional ArsR family regulator